MKIISKRWRCLPKFLDREQLADLTSCAKDPWVFISSHFQVVNGAFQPWDYQRRYVQHLHQHPHSIVMMPRRAGATTLNSAYSLWYALFKPGTTNVLCASVQHEAAHIKQLLKFAIDALPGFILSQPVKISQNKIEFPNGSEIIISTAYSFLYQRGLKIDRVCFDSFAHVTPKLQHDIWKNPSYSLLCACETCVSSTPTTGHDTFASLWENALRQSNHLKPFKLTVDDITHFDANFKSTMRSTLSEAAYRREFYCEFP